MAAAPVTVDDLENKPNNNGDKKDVARFQCHKNKFFQYAGSTGAEQVLRPPVRVDPPKNKGNH
jgi:hypothetical protein